MMSSEVRYYSCKLLAVCQVTNANELGYGRLPEYGKVSRIVPIFVNLTGQFRKGQDREREREERRMDGTRHAARGTRHRVVYEIDYPRPIRILFAYDNQ